MKPECKFFAGSARILNEETVMDVIRECAKDPVSTLAFDCMNLISPRKVKH